MWVGEDSVAPLPGLAQPPRVDARGVPGRGRPEQPRLGLASWTGLRMREVPQLWGRGSRPGGSEPTKQECAGSVGSRVRTSHGWERGGIAWPRSGRTGNVNKGAWSVTAGEGSHPGVYAEGCLSRGVPRLAFEQSQWSRLLSSRVSEPFHCKVSPIPPAALRDTEIAPNFWMRKRCARRQRNLFTRPIPKPVRHHGLLTLGGLWGAARWPDILGEERTGTGKLVRGPGKPRHSPGCARRWGCTSKTVSGLRRLCESPSTRRSRSGSCSLRALPPWLCRLPPACTVWVPWDSSGLRPAPGHTEPRQHPRE